MSIPLISGLYHYTRDGVKNIPEVTLREIPASLRVNSSYSNTLLVLAGDQACADWLASFGLTAHRVFDDAPASIHQNSAHKMKHWMCLWALREFGEFLWVDWDTVVLRPIDDEFTDYCRIAGTPKFIRIPNYWATVNCGVYYATSDWLPQMERSFDIAVAEPNDELFWAAVLPKDVINRDEFWWGERIVQIWNEEDFARVTKKSYFAHVKHLEWADKLRTIKQQRAMHCGTLFNGDNPR